MPDVSEILVEGLAVCDGGMDKGFGSRYGFKGRLAIGKACGDGSSKGTAGAVIIIGMDEWTLKMMKVLTIIADI